MCVVHTEGRLWPPHEFCYLRGVQGLVLASSEGSLSKGWFGGPRARWCTHVCGAHKGRYQVTVGVSLFKVDVGDGPRVERR